jgi:hypothetical protein
MDGIWSTYTGIPIIVTDKRKQKRTHRKRELIRSGLRDMDI